MIIRSEIMSIINNYDHSLFLRVQPLVIIQLHERFNEFYHELLHLHEVCGFSQYHAIICL